jgi:DNA-binding response OmpR family regulator
MMPGQSGPQLCENIRADPHGADVYLILLTSHESNGQIEEGLSAGADDYLVKPFDPAELELRLAVAATRMTASDGQPRKLGLNEPLATAATDLQN